MIAVIATVSLKPGSEAKFFELFRQLKVEVDANEPGTLQYGLYRSRDNEASFKIIEHYASTEAWMAHKAADYTRETVPKLHKLFDKAAAEILDSIED
ncbi:MAG: antibiotic biosynthesis monooxygenase family protein [Pseudomonadales bacterium]